MNNWLPVKIATLILLVFLSPCAFGTTTRTWTSSLESDFSKGVTRNTAIHSTGELRLSPKVEAITGIKGAFVWSIIADKQNHVYVGTGDPGAVYLIKDGSHAVELFKTPELYVQSLAADVQGNLYAGVAPTGIIYKIEPGGKATVFCDLPATYLWDMAVDGNSNLIVGTGNDGILYKVSPNGVPSVLFDSTETNIMDVCLDPHGAIYAGTEPGGLVYKITDNGQAQALYDACEDEIHCLALDSAGNVYAGTSSGVQAQVPVASSPQQPAHVGVVATILREERAWDLHIPEETPVTRTISMRQQKAVVREPATPSKIAGMPTTPNYIYKITPEGISQKIFETNQSLILDVSLDTHDNLYAVTGNNAGVYKVCKDEDSSSLATVEESQVICCLSTDNDELYIGTGNRGKVYKISPSFVPEGNFASQVYDAAAASNWGHIYWADSQPSGTKIALSTHTGNSERPDATWSNWSYPCLCSGEMITSPPARFIQYKATLQTINDTVSPSLNTVSLTYLPKNQSPKIINFTIEKEPSARAAKVSDAKASDKTEAKAQTTATQKPHHQVAQKTIQWEVEDPNNDTLQLTMYYKGIDEKAWRVIDKNTQKKGTYPWDTLRLPDGKYHIRLLVCDSPDNAPEIACTVEEITQPIVIDNSRPAIKSLSASAGTSGRYIISGAVKDADSQIIKVQYTLDGQEWISAYPVDGIFDSLEESFQITTAPLPPGDYTLTVNAFDAEGNIGIEKAMFEVK